MALLCPQCGENVFGDGVVTCECGYEVTSARPTRRPRTHPGWVGDALDHVAAALRTSGESGRWLGAAEIDAWLSANRVEFLESLVSSGTHKTVALARGNCRGWFNRSWTEGWNPYEAEFERSEHEPYRFRDRRAHQRTLVSSSGAPQEPRASGGHPSAATSAADPLQKAVDQAQALIRAAARRRRPITYGDLSRGITAIKVAPNGSELSHILAQITLEDFYGNRPLSTAVVTRADGHPGRGFFRLASKLGYDVSDDLNFWVREVEAAFDEYGAGRRQRRSRVGSPTQSSRRKAHFEVEDLMEFFEY